MAGSEIEYGRKHFWKRGEPMVWITGGALAVMVLMLVAMLGVIAVRGSTTFWLKDLAQLTLDSGELVLGELVQTSENALTGEERIQVKIGNRDLFGLDFRWIESEDIAEITYPEDAVTLERLEYGNFYGFVDSLSLPGIKATGDSPTQRLVSASAAMEKERDAIHDLEDEMGDLNRAIKKMQLALKAKFPDEYELTSVHEISNAQIAELSQRFEVKVKELAALEARLNQNKVIMRAIDGRTKAIPLLELVRVSSPNAAGLGTKLAYYLKRTVELFVDEPRESNTEGGLFPAIFGTVFMVFLMAILSFPLGVLAGIYLREYARDGVPVRAIRIAVNNLAGIPSIVYGIFGLGFFVYGVGSSIDQLFFSERLPEPTFGTGGVLWASLTLGILTIPVVIVSVEEALGSIPRHVRDSSLALGATKLQTLTRVILPMASPGIMTGFILAMARAAGEVAPLMITGVVKLAPSLPIDVHAPFVHLDRKFMHLGFHIYDISSQSPNVEAAKPMVYVTTLLLIAIVLSMSGLAIWLRNRMKKRYSMGSI